MTTLNQAVEVSRVNAVEAATQFVESCNFNMCKDLALEEAIKAFSQVWPNGVPTTNLSDVDQFTIRNLMEQLIQMSGFTAAFECKLVDEGLVPSQTIEVTRDLVTETLDAALASQGLSIPEETKQKGIDFMYNNLKGQTTILNFTRGMIMQNLELSIRHSN